MNEGVIMNYNKYIKRKRIECVDDFSPRMIGKIKEKYIFSGETPSFLWKYIDLFNLSLKRDLRKSIKSLFDVAEDIDVFSSLLADDKDAKREFDDFFEVLDANGIACTTSPLFRLMMKEKKEYLINSLMYDFNGTIEQCSAYYKNNSDGIYILENRFGFSLDKILTSKNFVLNESNFGVLSLGVEPLLVSLNNDSKKTLEILKYLIESKKLGEDVNLRIYGENAIKILKNNNFVIDESTADLLNYFPFLLDASLHNNFQKTIDIIANRIKEGMDFSNVIGNLGWEIERFFYKPTEFVLSEENIVLLDYMKSTLTKGKSLIYISFNNNFNRTAELLSKHGIFELDGTRLSENVIVSEDFVINDENADLLLNNARMFIASYVRNKEATIDYLRRTSKKFKFNYSDITLILQEHIILGRKKIGGGFSGYTSEYAEYEIDDIANLLIECINGYESEQFIEVYNKFSQEDVEKLFRYATPFVPKDILLSRPDLYIDSYSRNQVEIIEGEYLKSTGIYNSENEYKLLQSLGMQFKSIEEYVVSFANKEIRELSLLQITALNIYTRKELHKLGLDYVDVEFCSGRGQVGEAGSYDEKEQIVKLYISTCNPYSKCLELINYINHEVAHAEQHCNMKNNNFQNDPNILTYMEDSLLRIWDDKYYNDNYIKVSTEFDARFKADIKVHYLMGTLSDLYEMIKEDIKAIVANEIYEYGNLGKERADFEDNDIIRKYQGYELPCYVIFEKVLSEKLASDEAESIRKDILEKYPLVACEYDLCDGRRKTLLELVEEIENSKSKIESERYWYIIEQRYARERAASKYLQKQPEMYSPSTLPLKYSDYVERIFDIIKKNDEKLYETEKIKVHKISV